MIDSVESSREIKKNESSNFTVVNGGNADDLVLITKTKELLLEKVRE